MQRKIVILGSTGSIGKNSLQVAAHLKEKIDVVGLATHSNIDLFEQQLLQYRPKIAAVYDIEKARILRRRLPNMPILEGWEGVCEVAAFAEADLVVSAIVGAAGLRPTAAAIKAGKIIALANKEVLVAAGEYMVALAKKHGVTFIPVDSEHNALFQCLYKEQPSSVRRLILTSSGGPFRGKERAELSQITPDQALNHPNFLMGKKVTIDSSTLMNKGLEVIEAHWLFGVAAEQIQVVIHPQQKIHSMVEFIDGSILAQMCEPDMLVPIQHAMTFPERHTGMLPPYDFVRNSRFDFIEPDQKNFSCLSLAYHALKEGGSLPCYMNAANEILVNRFLSKEISWLDISNKLEKLMSAHRSTKTRQLDEILEVDALARQEAQKI